MRTLNVHIKDKAYPVVIDTALFSRIKWHDIFGPPPVSCALITNTTLAELHLPAVRSYFQKLVPQFAEIILPDGEEYKTLATTGKIYHHLSQAGLDRKSALIAFGGGVITDITGFAASTYMRGVRYYQIPTSLLAQVDSSVGGKTGVNLPEGKNLVGTFYQPDGVMCDLSFLETLPPREFREGMSEVLKAGFLAGGKLLRILKEKTRELSSGIQDILEEVVYLSIDYKREVVEEDELESGIRAVLNYGHTIGHALEKAAGYGVLRHGEAVAVGMVGEAIIGKNLGFVDPGFISLQEEMLRASDLPTKVSVPVSREIFFQALRQDKKKEAGQLRISIVKESGKPLFGIKIDEDMVSEVLPALCEVVEP